MLSFPGDDSFARRRSLCLCRAFVLHSSGPSQRGTEHPLLAVRKIKRWFGSMVKYRQPRRKCHNSRCITLHIRHVRIHSSTIRLVYTPRPLRPLAGQTVATLSCVKKKGSHGASYNPVIKIQAKLVVIQPTHTHTHAHTHIHTHTHTHTHNGQTA